MSNAAPVPAPVASAPIPTSVPGVPAAASPAAVPSTMTVKMDPAEPPRNKPLPAAAAAKAISKNHECPMFLRKTYHMVDTCDPAVATWSDDGETFVVKNTDVFEKAIIPQFFKHSKFSSFVRQLNFYGFRKIKYTDTIRIDPKLEAETANFWRFHHEKFRRGRPDLLVEIKRHGGKEKESAPGTASLARPEKVEDVTGVKAEVAVLKERIAVMSKSMDSLTSLVQKMSVKEAEAKERPGESNKRIKVEEDEADVCVSFMTNSAPCGIANDVSYTPAALFPSSVPSQPPSRQNSMKSEGSDEDFVDLFSVLEDDNLNRLADDAVINGESTKVIAPVAPKPIVNASQREHNRPDPQLMNELGDALSVLPKDVQEILIRRLISTITSNESVKGHVEAASALSQASVVESDEDRVKSLASPVVASPQAPSRSQSPQPGGKATPEVALPLAAATLGALLAKYGAGSKTKSCMAKNFLPVIPVHA